MVPASTLDAHPYALPQDVERGRLWQVVVTDGHAVLPEA